MNVELIDYTGKGRPDEQWHAANMLIFTKRTRLEMRAEGLADVRAMSEGEKLEELEYMASTIPSSWEFVSVTFLISGVTRAAAQQITRTRSASYAMQSQRVADVSGAAVRNPFSVNSPAWHEFNAAAEDAMAAYDRLITAGADRQDARGILPMNVTCNLVARYNLRSLVELVRSRSSLRTQGEYAQVARLMRTEVEAAWPWAEEFFRPKHDIAIQVLEDAAQSLGLEVGRGVAWKIAKAADLIRSET